MKDTYLWMFFLKTYLMKFLKMIETSTNIKKFRNFKIYINLTLKNYEKLIKSLASTINSE